MVSPFFGTDHLSHSVVRIWADQKSPPRLWWCCDGLGPLNPMAGAVQPDVLSPLRKWCIICIPLPYIPGKNPGLQLADISNITYRVFIGFSNITGYPKAVFSLTNKLDASCDDEMDASSTTTGLSTVAWLWDRERIVHRWSKSQFSWVCNGS